MHGAKRPLKGPNQAFWPVCRAHAAPAYAAAPRRRIGVENNKHREPYDRAPPNPTSSASSPTIPEVRFFDAFVNDLNTVERGKRIDRAGIAGVFKRGMPLPGSMFALDIEGGTVEDTGLGFCDGDADRPCMPIPGTLVPVPWQPDIAQVQLAMHEHDGTPFLRRSASSARRTCSARFTRLGAHAGRRDRIRVLSRRCRARCARPAAAAAKAR